MVKSGLAAAAIICVSLFAFACNDDGNGDDPASTPTASSSDATPGAGSTTTASTPEPDATAALETLEASLVTADELGAGWETQATDVPAETAESMCGTPVRIIAPDVLRTLRNLEDGHLFGGHGVSVYPDEATAAAEVDAVRAALASGCTELTTTSRNTTTEWVVAPVAFASYGDESLAIGTSTQFQGVPDPSQGYFVLIRRGPYVAVVIDIGAISVERAATEAIAAAADARLQALAAAH